MDLKTSEHRPTGASLDTGERMALALALAVGRQAGPQEGGSALTWALRLHPFHCAFHGHVPEQRLLPGRSQATAVLFGPFLSCLSTHSGPCPQGDPPPKPGLLPGFLAVRGLGSCRARP